MSRYRKVSVFIWNDRDFNELTDDAQLIFFFVLTHPSMTAIGAMRATIDGLAAEKKWSKKRLSKAFREVLDKGMIEFDEQANCLILPKFIKHNKPESPNVITGWSKAIDLIPESYLIQKQFNNIAETVAGMHEKFRKAFESLYESLYESLSKDYGESGTGTGTGAGTGAGTGNPPFLPREKKPSPEKINPKQIVEIYHEICSDLPKANLDEALAKQIEARCRADPDLFEPVWWSNYFEIVKQSDYLQGKINSFRANLYWLTGPKNMSKVLNGFYENRRSLSANQTAGQKFLEDMTHGGT